MANELQVDANYSKMKGKEKVEKALCDTAVSAPGQLQ